MNYCGTCANLLIGKHPRHEAIGLYRCKINGKFDTLTKPQECPDHVLTDDIEARRELAKGRK